LNVLPVPSASGGADTRGTRRVRPAGCAAFQPGGGRSCPAPRPGCTAGDLRGGHPCPCGTGGGL